MVDLEQGASASTPSETPSETPVEQESTEEGAPAAESGEASQSDQVADAKETLADPTATKAEKKAAEKTLKKFRLKVHGKEVEREIDLSDEADLSRRFQLAEAAQVKMQEATELRKAAEEFITLLKTNPRKVLSDPNIGVDLKELAKQVINQEIEDAQKSPEQIEKEKLQKELQELKEKHEKDERERKEREFTRLQAEQAEKIENDIETALKSSDLPKSPYTVRKMAELMMIALENNIDLSPKDLVPMLRKQMTTDIKELFGASSDDVLEELVGKERISAMRKKTVAKVKQQVAQTASQVKQTGADVKKEPAKEVKKMTIREFLRV